MESKKHSAISNLVFVWKPAIKNRPVYLLNLTMEAVLFAAMPLLASALSSAVIGLVGSSLRIFAIAAAILVMFLMYGGLSWLRTYLENMNGMAYVDARIFHHQMSWIRKNMNISLEQLESDRIRQLSQKVGMCLMGNNTGLEGMLRNMSALGANLLGLVFYVALVGVLNVKIMLFLLAVSLVTTAVSDLAGKAYERVKDRIASQERIVQYIDKAVDNIAGGKDIRVFGLDRWLIGKYDAAIREERRLHFSHEMVGFLGEGVEIVVNALRTLICYLYLISLLEQGMSVTAFVFYLGVIGGFAAWFIQISRQVAEIRRNSRQVDDFRTYLELVDGMEDEGIVPPEGFSQMKIEFDRVSYQYEGAEEAVLKNVSFTVKPGEHLALVGLNGAGKSTLVKLISGLYLPTSGSVRINGVDTRKLNRVELIRHAATIFQTPFVLSFSVGENVALREDFEEDRVWQAVTEAGLKEKITNLPRGLDTYLGKDIRDDGIQLSGGETQRLLLARALYRNPSLLLLDEPTAALDAIAENEIYEAYDHALREKTVLFISHRLASTRFCNSIFLLEHGEISEQGTHEELLEGNGSYAKLFRIQSKYYQQEA